MSMSRRLVILLACVASAAWVGSVYASPISFTVPLTGAEQVPPIETPAKGSAALTYDPATRVVTWTITYTGLSAPATMAHFHGPTEKGKNAPVLIWLSTKGSPAESPFKGEATLTPEGKLRARPRPARCSPKERRRVRRLPVSVVFCLAADSYGR